MRYLEQKVDSDFKMAHGGMAVCTSTVCANEYGK